jgi:hypothetical protein
MGVYDLLHDVQAEAHAAARPPRGSHAMKGLE